ncbi:MAG: serine/threonine protein kinase [Phycisphaeraceae bacterium]|nr:serine/threonine protein kinase [Phycisphaeraceae bacterium]
MDASAVGRAEPGAAGPEVTRIGPYRILKRLAAGGMGVVYLAQREGAVASRPVALKVVRAGSAVEDVLVRFDRERAVLASLDHPNIARLLDAGESERGEPYFAMEFVEGQPIDEWCDARRLSVSQRVELLRTVCDAVHHAHRNLVVHRDLKPRNILVGADGVPKLLDFGIAKLLNPALAPGALAPTAAGIQLMTPEYAAPEQVRGEPISTATDVYALGVILYELLTGRRPYRFITRDPAEIERVVTGANPPRPGSVVVVPVSEPSWLAGPLRGDVRVSAEELALRRGTSPAKLARQLAGDLDQVVLMALRQEPQRRYPSAEALGQDLRRHLDREPVTARPDALFYRLSRFASRHRGVVALALLLVMALAAGIGATAWQARRAAAERDAALAANVIAERRLGEVRTLIRSLLYDYHDAIARLAGAVEVRRRLVENALSHLARLREESSEDPELLIEVAGGYRRLAEIQGGTRSGNLGDTAAALATLAQSAALLEEARTLHGDVGVIERHLAANALLRADNLRLRGEIPAALESAETGLALRRAHADSGDELDRRGLAVALASVGDLLDMQGRGAEALAAYEQSLEIRRELLERKPTDADARREITTALLRIGWMESKAGRPERAVESYRQMLAIREAILAASDTARARRDVMRAHAVLAQALEETGRTQEAIEAARLELAMAEQLARDDPQNERARGDLVVARFEAGSILGRAGERSEAVPLLRLAIDGARTTLERDPTQRVHTSVLFGAREALADLLRQESATAHEAIQLYRTALATLAAAPSAGRTGDDSAEGAASTLVDLDRARLRISLASLQVELGSLAEPAELLDSALAALEGLPPEVAATPTARIELGRLALARAELLTKRHDFDGAFAVLSDGIEQMEHSAEATNSATSALHQDLLRRLRTSRDEIAARRR